MNRIFIHHCIKCGKEINTLTSQERLILVHIHNIGDLCPACYFRLIKENEIKPLKTIRKGLYEDN